MYATDASDYREVPGAVVYPKHEADLRELVRFAGEKGISLIPRTAGTSLAGQVVGNGLVVDMSRHMNRILELNEKECWVRVEPGVILDELNLAIRSTGLFFSPETSTSNRSMIGGMIGNNSCGLRSLVYGATRDHTHSVRAVLSDSTVTEFGPLNKDEFREKLEKKGLEGRIYRELHSMLRDPVNQQEILSGFPDPAVVRRNTGYALDELLDSPPYRGGQARYPDFNLCKLLAGSEGTLLLISEAKLKLVPLPPPYKALVPIHFNSVMEAIRGNLEALKHSPSAVELMDKTILDCTKGNLTQLKNRFFLSGDPGAILIVELMDRNEAVLQKRIEKMEKEMKAAGLGTHFPVVTGADIGKVWALRKSGLGVLSNIPGEGRPVSVIEDTSVRVEVLEEYIAEFNQILDKYDLECVYHAHISVGELHLRPIMNLKDPKHVQIFHDIALDTARLVKKYRGSLSGEHGDGRLRGEFIPLMVGERNFALIRKVKQLFDPEGIFNTGKITDTPPMNSFLRFEPGYQMPDFHTYFDYSREGGFMQLIEKCNGSGDCRKTEITGGTMCPSYMATRDEMATTRARANVLREVLSDRDLKKPFDQSDIYKVLDLCLSCKACKSECPSSVDMAKIKAEFMQHWYNHHPVPLRTLLIANISRINSLGMFFPGVFNYLATGRLSSRLLKRLLGFAARRSIPTLGRSTLRSWAARNLESLNSVLPVDAPELVLYVDEFSNYHDTSLGICSIRFFNRLGIRVFIVKHPLSGRTYISKGLLKKARKIARKNVEIFSVLISGERPLVGIEPSAILGFRDEFPELVGDDLKEQAEALSRHCFTIEEYLEQAFDNHLFDSSLFTEEKRTLKLHGHCQQKSIASTGPTKRVLSIPANFTVEEIPSGCCGMAGSFGYEKEHYELSMKVGELVLFPAVRESDTAALIVAPGTSCRHQIADGTGRRALHPVEVLFEALK
ncbi:MAG: FAD-linked oxidase C-terminal domain-containing protein [Bacteroidales bacterium]|nr:FAD-linked oxidase C-terminal domain-containing protein [Bacteroidales bacterium]